VKAVSGVMGITKRQISRSQNGGRPVKAVSGVLGTVKRQMARSETDMLQTCESVSEVMSTAKRQMVSSETGMLQTCTAKTKCRKFETNIPRKGISGPQSQFTHSCFCE
jgi:hypothetical protein